VSEKEVRMISEWGDVLRLPCDGPNSQDKPHIIAIRSMPTTWIGNSKLFPSVFDLMIAASQHSDTSKYYIASKTNVFLAMPSSTPAPSSSGWYIHPNTHQYHPMSGLLPPASAIENSIDRMRLLSIMLMTIKLSMSMTASGYLDGNVKIFANQYSTFSANLSPVILAISYFGLRMSGDGTVQDKLDAYEEYRKHLMIHIMDVVESYRRRLDVPTYIDCANRLAQIFNLIEKKRPFVI
jgi:hypothetical protein